MNVGQMLLYSLGRHFPGDKASETGSDTLQIHRGAPLTIFESNKVEEIRSGYRETLLSTSHSWSTILAIKSPTESGSTGTL